MPYSKKFISLDLETTHLDPLEGRIMEVGAVAVELVWDPSTSLGASEEGAIKVKFGKEFQSLVNPEIEVSPTALMLTGMTQEELKTAPAWKDVKEKFKDFLHGEMLLGHNIGFDLEFLRQQGLDLKNSFLDSLEIAQTLLPLAPSHSLEALGQTLDVPEFSSHRALGDSKSAALVVAAILNEFLGLPTGLQEEVRTCLLHCGVGFALLLEGLPKVKITLNSVQSREESPANLPEEKISFAWQDKTIYSLPMGFARQQEWLTWLAAHKKKALVGLSHELFLDFLPPGQRISQPSFSLCSKRWNRLKNQEKLPAAGGKILVKVLIFQHFYPDSFDLSRIRFQAWERDVLPILTVDPDVCPRHACAYYVSLGQLQGKVYFSKVASLLELALDWKIDFSSFHLLMFNLATIEDSLAAIAGETLSLGKIRKRLGLLYQLEGTAMSFYSSLPKPVELVSNELDLFFGILHLVYQKRKEEFSQNLLIDEQEGEAERFNKILPPAEKLIGKLKTFVQYLSEQILIADPEFEDELLGLQAKSEQFIRFLEEFFFVRKDDQVYWLRFDSEKVELGRQPKNLAATWRLLERAGKVLSLVDTELPQISFGYFQKRLSLQNYPVQKLETGSKPRIIKVKIFSADPTKAQLIRLINSLSGNTLLVLPNQRQFESYLDHAIPLQYARRRKSDLKKGSATGVLLTTAYGLSRYSSPLPPLAHLVLVRLPFEPPGKSFGSFMEEVLPRAVNILHNIFSRFAAAGGSQVFVADTRILKEYQQAFLKYFQEFPDYEISTLDPL